ncbi:MAG: DHH family phosphoesterase [Lachnospiraceae bacterium]|nr:DHH family phosphoesterase [Lachnospiraceae bacterium]
MNPFEKGRIMAYLRAPIYLALVLIAVTVGLFVYDKTLGMSAAIFVLIYALCVVVFYYFNRNKLTNEILDFAVNYGTVQRRLLNEFQLPYALLDDGSRIVWMNRRFAEVTGLDKEYKKSISTVFPMITREVLAKAEIGGDTFDIEIPFGDRYLEASLERLDFSSEFEERGNLLDVHIDSLVSLMLFDETEMYDLRQKFADQKLITALIYIDNYEETVVGVEDVKRSLLAAIIDRKISRFFKDADAIIRKTDKDKYFVIFQQKYLAQMEENNFSILEDVRTIKAGNEREITLSIGIGIGGSTYNQSAEFSRAAMDLALGRGGAQVVIKYADNVMYYGVRGREVERNTRVKARVKAQALREVMETKDNVIVMGHKISDADALGAAIGVYCAARELGKKCQIVLNTISSALRPLVETFSPEEGYPVDMFITSPRAMEILTPRTLVMVVDTNRPNYTECPELLERSNSIVVFDHHRQNNECISNPVLSYIEPYASSACEMIAETLQYFSERMEITNNEADVIFAGILIDTNNFLTKTGVRTFEAAAYLKRVGADLGRIRKLFREDMTTYKARAEVVRQARVYRNAFAFSDNFANELESPTIVGAQAANELLNIVGIKASFVMTEYKGQVYVSARSDETVNVQLIMEKLGGGGHFNVAGAQIEGKHFDEVERDISNILDTMIDKGEIVL